MIYLDVYREIKFRDSIAEPTFTNHLKNIFLKNGNYVTFISFF